MRVIDLTHTVTPDMPVYPGTEQPRLTPANTHEKDGFKETLISLFSHTGTHIDAPAHVINGRKTLDSFSPDTFAGKALVIDCRDIPNGGEITMSKLRPYGKLLQKADFLLFNIGYDRFWGTPEYFGDYPCINCEVLDFIVEGGYKGIGFDVMGLDPIAYDQLKRHRRLFEACDIINIENLCNLHLCPKGLFDFVCLPIKFENSDGAPARAVATVQ